MTTQRADNRRSLSPQRQLFVAHYLSNGNNATQAAISAGYASKHADRMGYQLLQSPHVAREIERKQNALQVQTDYSVSQWLADVRSATDKAVREGKYGPAMKGYELIGRNIGALKSERKLSEDEAKLFSYLGAAMERQKIESVRERAREELESAEYRELPPTGE